MDDDARALRNASPSDGFADPCATSCDDDDFVFQTHGLIIALTAALSSASLHSNSSFIALATPACWMLTWSLRRRWHGEVNFQMP
jgi:hypothetical protein